MLNEFGFETVDPYGNRPAERRRATLEAVDSLLGRGVPVHALGIQAHVLADRFETRFDAGAYRRLLGEFAARGSTSW